MRWVSIVIFALCVALLGCPAPEEDRRGAGPVEGVEVSPPVARPSRAREPVVESTPTAQDSPRLAPADDETAEACTCDVASEDNGWCDACGKGYVSGQPIACQTCATAAADARGGWCDDCDQGYLRRAPNDCQACVVAATGRGGWCADHGLGYVKGEKTKCQACATAGARCEACASQ